MSERATEPTGNSIELSRGYAKFAGRAEEMATLEAALERAARGRGQVVGVAGEAGLGKTRLCSEFLEHCRSRAIHVQWTCAVPEGLHASLEPIRELVRGIPGFEGGERRQNGSTELEVRRSDGLELARRLVRALGDTGTAVLLLEDLHWMDAASEDFIRNLVDLLPAARILLLVTFEPGYRSDWMQKANYQQLLLEPLGVEPLRTLLEDLLGTDVSLGDLSARIDARTQGNPLFIEQVVRSLVETGFLRGGSGGYRLTREVDRWAIPRTLGTVLAGRIDLLPERERHVLETAAVIGLRSDRELLAAAAALPEAEFEAVLTGLLQRGLLVADSIERPMQFAFAHSLARDVAYSEVLAARRARVHAALCRAVESLGSPEERAALLAHHYECAGELLEAARWQRRAAIAAQGREIDDPGLHWSRVQELVAGQTETAETVRFGAEACAMIVQQASLGRPTQNVEGVIAEGERLAARVRDPAASARMAFARGHWSLYSMACGNAIEELREARQAAEEFDEDLARAFTPTLAVTLQYTGPLAEALEIVRGVASETAQHLHAALGALPVADAHSFIAYYLALMGCVDEGRQELERCLELADPTHSVAVVEANAAAFARIAGDGGRAVALARRASAGGPGRERCELAPALVQVGRFAEAAAALEQSWNQLAPIERLRLRPTYARTWLGLGDAERAVITAQRGVDEARASDARVIEIDAQLSLASALISARGLAAQREIEAALRRGESLVADTGAHIFSPEILVERAAVVALRDQDRDRLALLRQAQRSYVEMGAAGRAEQLEGLL